MKVSPCAGKPAEPSMLVNVPRLVTAYYVDRPDPEVPAQRVAFGTSGHRGSAFDKAFNEWHILAISQAICLYRKQKNINGPLFLGMDTHALSVPALASALEVLAANGVEVMLAVGDEYTPTPAVSHAILTYNRGRKSGLADGIVITPSHNPPHDVGFKYNPPHGGPADPAITDWIQAKANEFLESGLRGVNRIPYEKALQASTTHRHNYLDAYAKDLGNVIDMEIIRGATIHLGVDPLGGSQRPRHGRMIRSALVPARVRLAGRVEPAAQREFAKLLRDAFPHQRSEQRENTAGSAGWLYRVALEAILGFRIAGDTLRFEPCVPEGWSGYDVTYRHRSATYRIRVENLTSTGRGVRSVTLDGQPVSGGMVPLSGRWEGARRANCARSNGGQMKSPIPITTLFLDIGGVLLTNGWDHQARKRAAAHFKLEWDEEEVLHHLMFAAYEEGKITLEEYLNRAVFNEERPFTREQYREFMFAQSHAYPEMIELFTQLKVRYKLKIAVVSNEAREVNAYRIGKFKLNEFVDFFISSCFVHLRKPDADIFRLALDIAQTPVEQILYVENTPMFVDIAEGLGIQSILHTDYKSTCAKLASFGLQIDKGVIHEAS